MLSDAEKMEVREHLKKARSNFLKITAMETRWEPEPSKFNIEFLKKAFEGIEDGKEVLDWLKNGIPLSVDHEEIEEKVKQDFKRHSCFCEPLAVLKYTEYILKEMEKGHILGPFDARSKL